MLKAFNNVTKFGEPVVNKGCSANDMCWFCDANDRDITTYIQYGSFW
ncbi:hypothetical protein ACQVSP_00990 [Bacillus pacificus]